MKQIQGKQGLVRGIGRFGTTEGSRNRDSTVITNEIPGELSRENMNVITCVLYIRLSPIIFSGTAISTHC